MVEISLNSWLYCSFPDWWQTYSLEHTIDRLGYLGYDSIELGAASPHAWPPYMEGERLESLQNALDENDLGVSSICPIMGGGPGMNPASPLEEERQAAIDHYSGCLRVADAVDCPVVIFVGGWRLADQRSEDAWNNMRSTLEEIVPVAEKHDVDLSLEATPNVTNVLETCQDSLKLHDEVPSDNVGTMFDTFHAAVRGESPAGYVEELGDTLNHLHLSDTERKVPGEGTLGFQPMFDMLDDIGYDGAYALEIFGQHLDPDEAAYRSLEAVEEMTS